MIVPKPPSHVRRLRRSDRKSGKWIWKAIASLCAIVVLTEIAVTMQIISRKTLVSLTFQQLRNDDTHQSFLEQSRPLQSKPKTWQNGLVPNNRLVIDILSAGSKNRPDFLHAQRETFAQHRSVRYFVGVTEDDDLTEPHCSSNLTRQGGSHYQVLQKS